MKICSKCGQQLSGDEKFCPVCGVPVPDDNNAQQQNTQQSSSYSAPYGKYPPPGYEPKSRLLAGLLGILLGGYGVHNFYLGFTTKAVIQILVTLVTCGIGGIWGFVEGILILCRKINFDAYNVQLKQDC